MLFSIDGKKITGIPRRRRAHFGIWRDNLSDSDYEAVVEAINAYVDSVPPDKPFVSSFIPGHDWEGTVYEPLYLACGRSKEQSGWFFGLIVWQVMIDRPDKWIFKPLDKEEDVLGTTYWRKYGRLTDCDFRRKL
ncbi:MAG: hypothetical protein JXN61_10460 [Sedimentisphaerales bacterium]|nr:hypothetical protein [Sedimentisphaerales bacterium]